MLLDRAVAHAKKSQCKNLSGIAYPQEREFYKNWGAFVECFDTSGFCVFTHAIPDDTKTL